MPTADKFFHARMIDSLRAALSDLTDALDHAMYADGTTPPWLYSAVQGVEDALRTAVALHGHHARTA